MPEPRARIDPRVFLAPAMWPDTLPGPQVDSMEIIGPPRTELSEVLFGPTRARVVARTAPMELSFRCWFTAAQMRTFEAFYRDVVENHDGEFYARWIGGSRIVALSEPYTYAPQGSGYIMAARCFRTRIDPTICDDYLEEHFGNLYVARLDATDVYVGDLAAMDVYQADWPLDYIAEHEC